MELKNLVDRPSPPPVTVGREPSESRASMIRAGEVADPAISTRDTLEKRASVIGVDEQTVHLATTRADGACNEAALNHLKALAQSQRWTM